MAKFRRKQIEVEAVQFVDGRYGEAIDFCPILSVEFVSTDVGTATVRTIRSATCGPLTPVQNGDWIVKDAAGSFSVMTNEAFLAENEPV